MKVGDIGVLQNLRMDRITGKDQSVWNGSIAEIISYEAILDNDYKIKVVGKFCTSNIKKDEIRPISDPDQEQSIEEKKELVKQRG